MQSAFRRVSGRTARWLLNRCLPLLLLLVFIPQLGIARPAKTMSPSVVLVLKLVSATRVMPVTGIVVSDDGLVLVPAEFAAEAGEIIVLDGGTDIVSNGRPAKLLAAPGDNGLALLSVAGLKRPGISLSASNPGTESRLHLEAFPPAEYIANGTPPLWLPIAADAPLPYVSGALIDACGYLAGLSVTHGVQTLEAGKVPELVFAAGLRRELEAFQLALPSASCNDSGDAGAEVIHSADDGNAEEQPANPAPSAAAAIETPEPDPQDPAPSPASDGTDDMTVAQEDQAAEAQNAAEIPPPVTPATTASTGRPSLWRSVPLWLPPVALIMLAAALWKGLQLLRLSRSATPAASPAAAEKRPLSASAEPDTAQLEAGVDTSVPGPRSAPPDEVVAPDMDALPAGCDSVLLIEGQLADHTPFKRYCAVDSARFSIVIGRGAADIDLGHPTISRAHTRLEGQAELLTLSDLGSSNGTFIRGIPCLPAEVLYLHTDDEVQLGDLRFTISLIRKQEPLS